MIYDRFDGSFRMEKIVSEDITPEHNSVDPVFRLVSVVEIERDAINAASFAQIDFLVAALASECTGHGALQPSGLTCANGDPAFRWQRLFESALDEIAVAAAIPRAVKSQQPEAEKPLAPSVCDWSRTTRQ